MESKALVRCWYGVLATLVSVALVGQIVLAVKHDRSLTNLFSYFTVQSNILVLIVSMTIVIDPSRDGRIPKLLRIAALTGITVTGMVYVTVIAPHVDPKGAALVFDVIFHYIAPVLTVLGFLLFKPRMVLTRSELAFMGWPVAWLLYTMIRAAVSHPDYRRGDGTRARYPYEFLDVDLHGWPFVLVALLLVTVLLIGLASIFIWASRVREPHLGARRTRAL